MRTLIVLSVLLLCSGEELTPTSFTPECELVRDVKVSHGSDKNYIGILRRTCNEKHVVDSFTCVDGEICKRVESTEQSVNITSFDIAANHEYTSAYTTDNNIHFKINNSNNWSKLSGITPSSISIASSREFLFLLWTENDSSRLHYHLTKNTGDVIILDKIDCGTCIHTRVLYMERLDSFLTTVLEGESDIVVRLFDGKNGSLTQQIVRKINPNSRKYGSYDIELLGDGVFIFFSRSTQG